MALHSFLRIITPHFRLFRHETGTSFALSEYGTRERLAVKLNSDVIVVFVVFALRKRCVSAQYPFISVLVQLLAARNLCFRTFFGSPVEAVCRLALCRLRTISSPRGLLAVISGLSSTSHRFISFRFSHVCEKNIIFLNQRKQNKNSITIITDARSASGAFLPS